VKKTRKPSPVGTIIQRKGDPSLRWRVLARDRETRTLLLERWDGKQTEIADNDPNYEVAARPNDWPFVPCPSRQNDPVVEVLQSVRGKLVSLEPMYDWVPSSRLSTAGSLYFNPALDLMTGDILIAVHQSGHRNRVSITRQFGSLKKRQARIEAARKKAEGKEAWSHLGSILDDD